MTSAPPHSRRAMLERLASAPISWGVCEVPGWGIELPVDRVLREMREVGMVGTELGSPGYFPTESAELRALLTQAEMPLVAGFVGLVLHEPSERSRMIEEAQEAAELLAGGGAEFFVTAALAEWEWGSRFELDEQQWGHVADSLQLLEGLVADYGLEQAVHPHVGTMIETASDVRQVLARTTVGWCYDTGHLLIGGYDPLEFLHDARDRIRHVHLKDVRMATAQRVVSGELSLMQGVQEGMFCPMGRGDVPIAQIVTELESSGYDRWYVLEQDAALTEGIPPEGSGPILDVRESVDHLRSVARDLTSTSGGSR